MEGEFQDQWNHEHYLEERLSPRVSQPSCILFYEEYTQDYTQTEGSDSEGVIINNPAPEGDTFRETVVIIRWLDEVEGPRVKVSGLICDGLYKEYN